MVGTPSKDTSHIVRVFDLTYFARSQRSKFKITLSGGTFCCYLIQRVLIWCGGESKYPLCVRQISAGSDFKYGRNRTFCVLWYCNPRVQGSNPGTDTNFFFLFFLFLLSFYNCILFFFIDLVQFTTTSRYMTYFLGGHLGNQSFAILKPMVVARVTKFLWWVCLIRLHHISPGFLI